MCQGIIYKATNQINGKCYIGKTIQKLEERKSDHIKVSKKLKKKSECIENEGSIEGVYFHNALNKYGKENFKWEIIYECDDELVLNVMETMKIIVNHSHYTEGKGYNLTWGGDGLRGYKHTEETKKKLSNKLKEFYLTEKGKEARLKMSKSQKGHSVSDEQRRKQTETCVKKRLEREANKS